LNVVGELKNKACVKTPAFFVSGFDTGCAMQPFTRPGVK
jgi:hypothetical protein